MIIEEITRDDVITVLEHVQATCEIISHCESCTYCIPGDGCALAHLPWHWKLDYIISKVGDEDDKSE